MKIVRVFPRRTEATPTDELAFVGDVPMLAPPECDEVHVSCAFTFDIEEAERLARSWEILGVPVRVGGPAYGKPSAGFSPGLYVKPGIVFSSRGCPNNCWFCRVPKVEGKLREYEVQDGFNICDDNLLACSEQHTRSVFAMLDKQKERPLFTGGLEAKILKPWHVDLLQKSRVERMYFAYDTPDDYEPLCNAGSMLSEAGMSGRAYAYVLIGYRGDTVEKAEKRLIETWNAGFMPYAMLYLNEDGANRDDINGTDLWKPFQRLWARPAIVRTRMKKWRQESK